MTEIAIANTITHKCDKCKSEVSLVVTFDAGSRLLPKKRFCSKCQKEIEAKYYDKVKTGVFLSADDKKSFWAVYSGVNPLFNYLMYDWAKIECQNKLPKIIEEFQEKYGMLNHTIDPFKECEFLRADYKINSQGKIVKC